ncbi:DUF922 domain-containing protein [uncultured Muriicola sp.]|uniref:DUF922 domain-containing protein n=1 Tax=uncultured Muriicola sp. TaxID=1583102 RepID=UPI00262416A7|nr:DUF922 domain-containing protein [uncultured Muriicola sp.]
MGLLRSLFLCIILATAVNGNCQEENAIKWDPDHRLRWSDFKAQPQENSPVAAITASGIAYRFSAMENRGRMEVDCTIDSFFFPESSWYKRETANDIILSHEQLHFDISELFARKMRERVESYSFSSNVKAEMNGIYEQIIREMRTFQKRYDEETNFSREVEKQLEWNRKISSELKTIH